MASSRTPAISSTRAAPSHPSQEPNGILSAFADDTGPAADAIKALLEDPSPEAAKALLDRLPDLLPEDPALAAVIAEEMAKEFGKEKTEKREENKDDDEKITQELAEKIYEEMMSK